jgi:hypothetical protein
MIDDEPITVHEVVNGLSDLLEDFISSPDKPLDEQTYATMLSCVLLPFAGMALGCDTSKYEFTMNVAACADHSWEKMTIRLGKPGKED